MKQAQLHLFAPWSVQERISARARRIRVEVRPDGEVVLTIPRRASREAARRFLEQSRAWIERARARLRQRATPASALPQVLRWDGSDRISLRGGDAALAVEFVEGRGASAEFTGDTLRLRPPAAWRGDGARLSRLLGRALRDIAGRDARALLDEESARLALPYRSLSIRDTRSRWGSCGPDGRIMLSLRLVLAPPAVFRYVVVHELCHLRWRGHGPRFWALVARQMPDFERQRDWLRRNGAGLHRLRL